MKNPDKDNKTAADKAFDLLTAEDDGRVCKDIPDAACNHQPKNFFTHILSLSATKLADGLIDPKLVLSWIFSTLGVPAFYIGLLVPVREAGALLPQLFSAGFIRSLSQRKWAWAVGSLIQGLCAAGIGLAVVFLEGAIVGITVVSLLAILACARSICSVSYKDVLGKTVDKSKRGTATGTASSIAAGAVIIFALLLSSGLIDKMMLVVTALFLAGGLWVIAALLFTGLAEQKGATEGGGNPLEVARENFQYLATDTQLRLFILTRGLLVSTALAPPFMVALAAGDAQSGYEDLGLLVLASAGASLVSSYLWGRLADRSSRRVLMYSALAATLALAATVVAALFSAAQLSWLLPVLLFALMAAYQGVRLGRSTHLVDMADEDKRAAYTALSNTIIGLLLLAGGTFSLIAEALGTVWVLAIMALMSAVAVATAYGLREEQRD